ncbi:hypothetical protein HRbin36_01845 [bacterium HR36]|nr:hypothetical protein HRbin36_01845 [bacterium HR36]
MPNKKLSIEGCRALVWLLAGMVFVAAEGRGLAQQEEGKLLFFDAFEYEVKRDVRDPRPAFLTQGKWSGVKSINSVGRGAGYLYTVDRIPGYAGQFPGRNSKRVLAIEGRSGTFQTQTDFWLRIGDPNGPPDQIPGNVWFQFWIYLNYYDDPEDKEDQLSGITGGKWLYPSPDGFYPAHPRWLFTINHRSHVWPKRDEKPHDYEAPSYHEIFIQTEGLGPGKPPVPFANIKKAPEYNRWKMGQTNIDTRIVANRWFLVKLHFDTSTTSGRYEAWLQPLGGKMVKVAEYIDGVTPDFSWTIPKEHVGGHKTVSMPTTLGSFTPERAKNNKDCWIYLDDFAMATSEDTLPTYSESK